MCHLRGSGFEISKKGQKIFKGGGPGGGGGGGGGGECPTDFSTSLYTLSTAWGLFTRGLPTLYVNHSTHGWTTLIFSVMTGGKRR